MEWNRASAFTSSPSRSGRRWIAAQCVWAAALTVLSGCTHFPHRGQRPAPPPLLRTDITRLELIDHLNRNSDAVHTWVSRACKIRVRTPQGLTARMHATMACAEPDKFRLSAKGAFAAADLGSNEGMCWWWTQPGDGVMFLLRHEDIELVRGHPAMNGGMSMPFEPDWLVEVLGIKRLDAANLTLHRGADPSRVDLASGRVAPDGRVVRRIITVDLNSGDVVAHRIVDHANNTIVRAKLSGHRAVDGVRLPRLIVIESPQMGMSMRLEMDEIEINGSPEPEVWEQPRNDNVPVVNLGDYLRTAGPAPGRERPRFEEPNRLNPSPSAMGVPGDEDLPWEQPPRKRGWFRWPFRR